MPRRARLVPLAITAAVALTVPFAAGAATAADGPVFEVAASGLDNPRGIAIGKAGEVFVAEAGHGGTSCDKEKANCAGATGAIARLKDGKLTRVVTGLSSFAGADGTGATGSDGIAVAPDGTKAIANTGTLLCAPLAAVPTALRRFVGHVAIAKPNAKKATPTADIQKYECAKNPDKTDRNSNPYAIVALSKSHQLVVDAGANAIFDVRGKKITVAAIIPSRKVGKQVHQPVPTSIAKGPGGAYYVGTLDESAGNGQARVWRWVPGKKPTVYRDGFTGITGLAFDGGGNMYVSEFTEDWAEEKAPTGALLRVSADGKTRDHLGAGTIFFPGGLAYTDGSLYISNWSIMPATAPAGAPTGQLLRTPVATP